MEESSLPSGGFSLHWESRLLSRLSGSPLEGFVQGRDTFLSSRSVLLKAGCHLSSKLMQLSLGVQRALATGPPQ